MNKYGYIYEELNYRIRKGWALAYPLLYQLRLTIMVFILLYLKDIMVLQVNIVATTTIF